MSFDDLKQIHVEATHVLDFEGSAKLDRESSAPPTGQRFVLEKPDQLLIFDGLNQAGSLNALHGHRARLHPTESIVSLYQSADGMVHFYDFSGKFLHEFQHPLDSFSVFEHGFEVSGSYFLIQKDEDDSSGRITTWAAETPIAEIGHLKKATHSIEISSCSYNDTLEPPLIDGWRTILTHGETVSWQQFRTIDGKLELGTPIEAGQCLCFSIDGREFLLATYGLTHQYCNLHRHDYHSAQKTGNSYQYKELSAPLPWPGCGIDLTPLEQQFPTQCVPLDLVRYAFLTERGRIPILHTRSMTFECELKIEGIHSPIIQMLRSGRHLVFLVKPDYETSKLVFVDADVISNANVN